MRPFAFIESSEPRVPALQDLSAVMNDILRAKAMGKKPIVILDLDNTTYYIPGLEKQCRGLDRAQLKRQGYGGDAWFHYRVKALSRREETFSGLLAKYNALQSLVRVEPVQEDVADLIVQLQGQGVSVIGLTARGHEVAKDTVGHLNKLGISMSPVITSPTPTGSQSAGEDETLKVVGASGSIVHYYRGVFFCSGKPKSACLEAALQSDCGESLQHYKMCYFFDDALKNCLDMRLNFRRRGTGLFSYHYTRADELEKPPLDQLEKESQSESLSRRHGNSP